ncbi:hypothetical protein F5Y04DRAFT_278039 [Hypomontagnella monticulosa]|nr:hypothetical protein F5Y04DRAFT_278039 [Hypomontagnella monticulosa]
MDTAENRNLFDRLAPEVITLVCCDLPDARSAINLGRTSRRLHRFLSHNESLIAREIAIKVLQDSDPGLVKLAFMMCETRLLRPTTADSVRDFLETYVHRGTWPSKLYRLRAVGIMHIHNLSMSLVLDWELDWAFHWPSMLADQQLTATERCRHMRLLYMFEIGTTLLHPIVGTIPERDFEQLAQRYWNTFSEFELAAAHSMLWRLASESSSTVQFPDKKWVHRDGRYVNTDVMKAIHGAFPLAKDDRDLEFIRLSTQPNEDLRSHWFETSPIVAGLCKFNDKKDDDDHAFSREPFTPDPDAFFTKGVQAMNLLKPGWGKKGDYYPSRLSNFVLCSSFLMIGDKTRCEWLLEKLRVFEGYE